jgi:acyl-CoA synthetase (NDP forming)
VPESDDDASTGAPRGTGSAGAPPAHPHPLDPIFHPRSIAVVGTPSGDPHGGNFLRSLRAIGYDAAHALYPVNPKGGEIGGLPAYRSLLDCPGPVDHVISQVPAAAVAGLVEQCVEKGVRTLHLFTAGFSETGDPERAAAEHAAVGRAVEAGIHVIGPNCMGIYVPEERISFTGEPPTEAGNVFLLSQSGVNAADTIFRLGAVGLRFSKVVSYGNGADLTAHDFLDYAAADPQTDVVAAYIEGVSDGPAFAEALRRCARVKPTVILKGGLTEAGARAARSHTGSLAGSRQVFEALCRQAGALRVDGMAELRDMLLTLTTSALQVRGDGVAMLSSGGGFAVLSSDAIAEEGLAVPELPEATQRALGELVPVAGTSVRNPVDASFDGGGGRSEGDLGRLRRAVLEVGQASVTDVVFLSTSRVPWLSDAGAGVGEEEGDPYEAARALGERIAALQGELEVPLLYMQRDRIWGDVGTDLELARAAYAGGVAVYGSVERAAHSVAQLLAWRERRDGLPAIL